MSVNPEAVLRKLLTVSTSEIQLFIELKTVCSSWQEERYRAARKVQISRVEVIVNKKYMSNNVDK